MTNAIYFKGNWARQFKKDRTREASFTLASGEKVDVPMMNQTGEFRYMEAEDFQALELPYVDNELSMIILLPKETDGLPEFEKKLKLEDFSQWLDGLHRREVIVSVPKFKTTSQFSLASVLKSMGMADAFCAGGRFFGNNRQQRPFHFCRYPQGLRGCKRGRHRSSGSNGRNDAADIGWTEPDTGFSSRPSIFVLDP